MIQKHCGQFLIHYRDNKFYFTVKCKVCGKIFTQHKRQPKNV